MNQYTDLIDGLKYWRTECFDDRDAATLMKQAADALATLMKQAAYALAAQKETIYARNRELHAVWAERDAALARVKRLEDALREAKGLLNPKQYDGHRRVERRIEEALAEGDKP